MMDANPFVWSVYHKVLFFGLMCTLLRTSIAVPVSAEEAVFAKYRPLAMDESWRMVGPDDALDTSIASNAPVLGEAPTSIGSLASMKSANELVNPDSYSLDDQKFIKQVGQLGIRSLDDFDSSLHDIKEWDRKSKSEKLFLLPEEPFPSEVIAAKGGESPTTFVVPEVQYPQINSKINNDTKVIASYRIMIPIYIPALRKKAILTTRRPPPKYVKETVTEMVPIKQIVPHVKEIVKAEPLPQSMITDFVEATDKVAKTPNDRVRPNEMILSSVVDNID